MTKKAKQMSLIFVFVFLATKVANVEMVHIRVANFLDLSPKLKQKCHPRSQT